LNGSLKSITDYFNNAAYYSADKIGRTTAIGNASDADKYLGGITHRAFGAVKSMSMNTTAETSVTMTYDDALRPATYEAENSTTGNNVWVQKANYTYHKDGMVKQIDNAREGTTYTTFDQTNDYDFAGRLKKNQSSAFWQTLAYDAFSNLTDRQTKTWSLDQIGFTETYENNRNSSDTYDEAGNVIASQTTGGGEAPGGGWYDSYKDWKFDASGRMNRWEESGPWGGPQGTHRGGQSTFDGDGRPAKYAELERPNNGSWASINFYYLYSSVTGQKITDIAPGGADGKHRVFMGDTVIHDNTYQGPYVDASIYAIGFKVTDPVSGSTQEMNPSGAVPSPSTYPHARNELGALGTSIPATAPTPYAPNYLGRGGHAGDAGSGCTWNGAPIKCDLLYDAVRGTSYTSEVNTRAEGGWDLYQSLASQITTYHVGIREHEEKGGFDGPDWYGRPTGNSRVTPWFSFTAVGPAVQDLVASAGGRGIDYGQREYSHGPSASATAGFEGAGGNSVSSSTADCLDKLNALLKTLLGEKAFGKLTNSEINTSGFVALMANFLQAGRVHGVIGGNSNYDSTTGTITMNVDPARGEGFPGAWAAAQRLEFIHELLHGARRSGFSHEDIYKAMSVVDGLDFTKFSKDREKQLKAQGAKKTDDSMYRDAMNQWIRQYCG
jgi:hypothetical protein